MPGGITKQGAVAIDEIVMGMQISGVDRIKQLLVGGYTGEAIKEAERLSPDDLQKLAADLNIQPPETTNEVEQSDSAVSPPKAEIDQEHELDESSDLGTPNSQPGESPAPDSADINPVEGEDNTDAASTDRAPGQVEEEATPPGGTEDPGKESPTTTVPDSEVSVATKQATEEDSEETTETTETETKETKPAETKETESVETETKETETTEEAPEEENPIKSASLQGYVQGSQDALMAIIKSLQNK